MGKEDKACENTVSMDLRIIQSLRLEKTLKIIKFNHKPNTAKSITTPCP